MCLHAFLYIFSLQKKKNASSSRGPPYTSNEPLPPILLFKGPTGQPAGLKRTENIYLNVVKQCLCGV